MQAEGDAGHPGRPLNVRLAPRRPQAALAVFRASAVFLASAAGLMLVVAPVPAGEPLTPAVEPIVRHATSSPDGSAAFTFVPADLRGEIRELPIGVFDSGIGGLTVLEAILAADAFDNRTLQPGPDGRPDFAGERFVYLGDQANMPYGNYPPAGNEAYLRELIVKDAVFLLGRRAWPAVDAAGPTLDKPPVKAIVIACNTATAFGLDDVRTAIERWRIPVSVVGVVEAGAGGVLASERDRPGRRDAIAVLATVGTCSSGAYPRAIAAACGRAGSRVPAIVQRGFADLAAAIEGDPLVTSRVSIDDAVADGLRGLLDDYRRSRPDRPIGRVLLGCTHFPLVRERIVEHLERLRRLEEDGDHPFEPLIAGELEVIDPALLTAADLFRTLARARLRTQRAAVDDAGDPVTARARFYVSVAATGDGEAGGGRHQEPAKFRREPGRLDLEDTRIVPLAAPLATEGGLALIRARLPHVWQSLGW